MTTLYLPCDDVEELNERQALADLLDKYEALMDKCYDPKVPLTIDEQARLDEMHECLMLMEHDRWRGVSYGIIEMLQEHTNHDFPMIQYEIDHPELFERNN